MMIKKQLNLWFISIVTFVFISGLLLIALPVPVTEAGAGLPNRNTPTPARSSESDDDKDSGPAGAHIELQATNVSATAWSVVQWQDSAGNWREVEGWRGTLDESGQRRWWVHQKDFGDGPFRWVVTQGRGGPVLGVSRAFNLPSGANEIVQVSLTIE